MPTGGSAKSLHDPSMRLAALNTRRASGLRPRYAPRAIIVLDGWGHRRCLLLLTLTAPSALGRRWLRIHIHPSRVRVRALPTHRGIDRGSTATELSGRRRFPPVPLLRLDVDGVEANATGSAGSASGLGCELTRGLWTAVRADGGCVPFP
jgi:hypothetical protein